MLGSEFYGDSRQYVLWNKLFVIVSIIMSFVVFDIIQSRMCYSQRLSTGVQWLGWLGLLSSIFSKTFQKLLYIDWVMQPIVSWHTLLLQKPHSNSGSPAVFLLVQYDRFDCVGNLKPSCHAITNLIFLVLNRHAKFLEN